MLASDGIWDVLTNDDVVKLCLKKMSTGIPPEQICEEIMTECLSPDLLMIGTDNMTIVLACFKHNKSYDDFCKRAAEYCLRLFPDDEKLSQQDKSIDQSADELSPIVEEQQKKQNTKADAAVIDTVMRKKVKIVIYTMKQMNVFLSLGCITHGAPWR